MTNEHRPDRFESSYDLINHLRTMYPDCDVCAFDEVIHVFHPDGSASSVDKWDALDADDRELREMFDTAPLVAGGQGRTGPDVVAAAGGFLGLAAILASAFLMGILAYQIVQLFTR